MQYIGPTMQASFDISVICFRCLVTDLENHIWDKFILTFLLLDHTCLSRG